jgi:hypothetical protein
VTIGVIKTPMDFSILEDGLMINTEEVYTLTG